VPLVTSAVKSATGASPPEPPVTVTCAVPFTPSAAAVTVVVPAASAVKRPVVAFTVPTPSSDDDQVKTVSVSRSQYCVEAAAEKVVLSPTPSSAATGVTVTTLSTSSSPITQMLSR